MSPQLERLFHSVRRGIEANVKTALKTMEVARKQDLSGLKDRIDHIAKNELAVLRKKIDEIRNSLDRVEAIKPYLSAIKAAAGAYASAKKPRKRSENRSQRSKRKRQNSGSRIRREKIVARNEEQ